MGSPFESLTRSLTSSDPVEAIRGGLIGEGLVLETRLGPKPVVYADYVASGRALRQVEDIIRDEVLPYYANTHSDSSYLGEYMTQLRETARRIIAEAVNAPESHATIFSGSGATSGLNQLVRLMDIEAIAQHARVVVLVGPYEHHSNILPWRESGAEVVEIAEGKCGGPDLVALEAALKSAREAALVVGAFSAASNVTGTLTDANRVTELLKSYGAIAVWDYACAGPYVAFSIDDDRARKDAVVISSHKFVGGPGASGVLVVNRALVRRAVPTRPGGGTVEFVSPWAHRYSNDLVEREEGGTPNILGDIRAAMAFTVKGLVDADWLRNRQEEMRLRALRRWRDEPGLQVLGHQDGVNALPIFSLQFFDALGNTVGPRCAARYLSDVHGLQVRAGCSCAGPYGHRLLGITHAASEQLLSRIDAGEILAKPGWVRLNLSPYMDDEKVDWIIETIALFARHLHSGTSLTQDLMRRECVQERRLGLFTAQKPEKATAIRSDERQSSRSESQK